MGDNRCAKHKYYGIPPSHCFVCEVLALRAEVERLHKAINELDCDRERCWRNGTLGERCLVCQLKETLRGGE